MDTDHLASVLAANPNVVMIYTIPEFQNPTGATMNLERRKHLIELANKYNVLVVEDTAYRELRYVGEQLPTIKSLDTEGRVIHLGSFSKILAPAMRLGWALASPEILDKLSLLKLASDTQNSTLNMNATLEYLRRHSIDKHIEKIRPNYLRKRDLMLSTMREVFPNEVSFTEPEGGLFTWLTFPAGFDATVFMKETLLPEGKVAYVPGATFFPVDQEPNHARVNFSGVEDDQIVQGISRLGKLLKQTL
jgi:2-aminoadipate transaminase